MTQILHHIILHHADRLATVDVVPTGRAGDSLIVISEEGVAGWVVGPGPGKTPHT